MCAKYLPRAADKYFAIAKGMDEIRGLLEFDKERNLIGAPVLKQSDRNSICRCKSTGVKEICVESVVLNGGPRKFPTIRCEFRERECIRPKSALLQL